MTSLRERFGTLVGVDRAVENGDFVSIDLSAEIEGEEIDSVDGRLLRGRLRQHAPRHGRGPRRHGRRRDQELHRPARRWRPRGPGRRLHRHRPVASRCASCPSSTTSSPSSPREFDTLDELRADVASQAEQAKKFEQGIQARDKVLEHLLETIEIPVPDSIVEAEVHSHLEGEGRLEDDEHRAEVDE